MQREKDGKGSCVCWLLLACGLCLLVPSVALAGVPQTLQFQGYLTDAQGKPKVGVLQLTFRLYKDNAAKTALWEETLNVALQGGHFTVQLGTKTPLATSLFVANEKPYLGTTIENDPEMKPRMQIASVPYALVAQTLAKDAAPDIASLKIAGQQVINSKGAWTGTFAGRPFTCPKGESAVGFDEKGKVTCAAVAYPKADSDSRYVRKTNIPKMTCRLVSKRLTFGSTLKVECNKGEYALSGSCANGRNPTIQLSSGVPVSVTCTGLSRGQTAQSMCCQFSY